MCRSGGGLLSRALLFFHESPEQENDAEPNNRDHLKGVAPASHRCERSHNYCTRCRTDETTDLMIRDIFGAVGGRSPLDHHRIGGRMKDDLAQSEERSYYQEKPEGGSKTVQKDACAAAKHTQHSQAFTPKTLNQITCRTLKNTDDAIHRPE